MRGRCIGAVEVAAYAPACRGFLVWRPVVRRLSIRCVEACWNIRHHPLFALKPRVPKSLWGHVRLGDAARNCCVGVDIVSGPDFGFSLEHLLLRLNIAAFLSSVLPSYPLWGR